VTRRRPGDLHRNAPVRHAAFNLDGTRFVTHFVMTALSGNGRPTLWPADVAALQFGRWPGSTATGRVSPSTSRIPAPGAPRRSRPRQYHRQPGAAKVRATLAIVGGTMRPPPAHRGFSILCAHVTSRELRPVQATGPELAPSRRSGIKGLDAACAWWMACSLSAPSRSICSSTMA
jgi:hypothetical protein